jgi:hypothetical protein
MNFNEFWSKYDVWEEDPYISDYDSIYVQERCALFGWNAAKAEILKLLEENKELESISQKGKKVYKIYGSVIDKIKNEI